MEPSSNGIVGSPGLRSRSSRVSVRAFSRKCRPFLISLPRRRIPGRKFAPAHQIGASFIDEVDVTDPLARVGKRWIKGILPSVMGRRIRGKRAARVRPLRLCGLPPSQAERAPR